MLDSITWRHIPCLLAATPMLLGGLVHGLLRPKEALIRWGTTVQTASSRDAQIVYYGHTMRTSTFGLLLWIFYLQNNMAAVDVTMFVIGAYSGIADVLIIWYHGERSVTPVRLASVLAIAAWGAAGMTAAR